MNITVKIHRIILVGPVLAVASIVIDDAVVVYGLRLIQGPKRVFVAFPQRPSGGGRYLDILHPINTSAREQIERAVIEAYDAVVSHG